MMDTPFFIFSFKRIRNIQAQHLLDIIIQPMMKAAGVTEKINSTLIACQCCLFGIIRKCQYLCNNNYLDDVVNTVCFLVYLSKIFKYLIIFCLRKC